jgi:hypothetical protein
MTKLPKLILLLSSAAMLLSACGQINTSSRNATISGVSSNDASNYIPVSASPTPSPSTSTISPISGISSSQAPTLSNTLDNGGSNTLSIGSNISFVAPFQPDSTLVFQWYKNGSAISGANQTEFSLISIKASDYGSYTVKASNPQGSLTSAAFTINPILMLATLGSHDCNGSQCWNDGTTADKVCKIRFGSQSVMYGTNTFGPAGVKWTTDYCAWNGSDWTCQHGCTFSCSGFNVLGYVYCLQ